MPVSIFLILQSMKCTESEEEEVTKGKENQLQLSCFINQEVKYLFTGLKLVRTIRVNPHCLHIPYLHLLKFICNSRISIRGVFMVIWRHAQSGKKFESPGTHYPTWGPERWCFSSHTINNCPFAVILVLHFLHFFCLLIILLFKVAFRHSAEVLPSFLNRGGLWYTLWRK